MKKVFLTFICFTLVQIAFSQQDAQFSQFMYNKLFPNPAVAGSNGAICATMIGRQQWIGFEGRPETYMFSLHGPVPILRGGLGLSVAQDKVGQVSNTHIKGAYAFRMKLGPGEASAGASLGMLNTALGANWEFIDPNDPEVPINGNSASTFDMDFGFYYSIPEKLYAGISSTHLFAPDIEGTNQAGSTFQVARHYFITAGYYYQLTPSINLQPAILIKSDGANAQFDVNVSAVYNNFLWGGITYRVQDAIVPMVGVDYKMGGTGISGGTLRIGYSYDLTTSLIRTGSSGSHEILLNYCFNIPKKIKISQHKSVRFL